MAKQPDIIFSCAKCGAQTTKWAGRCEECGAWGSLSEEQATAEAVAPRALGKPGKTQTFASLLAGGEAKRVPTNLVFWDRLLAGGFVDGSVSLLGGEPGIGKSTLLAQLGLQMVGAGKTVLYVTGEESPSQILMRLKRLNASAIPSSFTFLDTTDAAIVAATIRDQKPSLAIIDSVQTLRVADAVGESGNPTQMKASAATVSEAAKQSGTAVVLVGQVTKEGDLAGPRLLEHLVDTVMMMEGDRYQAFRLLRIVKHRFGSTEESAILSMDEQGLHEVLDPSAALIADRPAHVSGSVVTCLSQGSRPLLVEIQALVNAAGYGTPSRRSSGIDQNRLSLLLAVLGRRCGISFGDQDVFVNAVGGVDAKDPSIDLALALALASARFDIPIPIDAAVWGEVGLSGEIRPVSQAKLRTKEAERLGLKPMTSFKTLREAVEALGLKK